MDVIRGVLVAVVLLDFAVGTKDKYCNGGGLSAICEIKEVQGAVATLTCGQGLSSHRDRTNQTRVVYDNILNDSDTNNASGDRNTFHEHPNVTFGDDASGLIPIEDNGYNYPNNYSIENNLSQTKHYFLKKSVTVFTSFTTLKVVLNSAVSLLDLTCFPNVKTVSINTSNHSLLRTCATDNVSDLSITFSHLREFPFIQYYSGVKELNLSSNNIKEIQLTQFPSTVRSLDLSFNELVFNENISLPISLRYLNISYNNITINKHFVLKGNLSALNVRGNRLKFIPNMEMMSLEDLDLSENNILQLDTEVFERLVSLTVLDLRQNALTSLKEEDFQGLDKLQRLDISENNIMYLSPATFQYLNNLVTLTLSGNTHLGRLRHIKDASLLFGTSQRLQIIEASRTNLTRVPPTLTRSVRKLFLAENAISIVQCGELDSFPLLQTIDISRNMIYDIEEDALGRLDFLSYLILYDNKLTTIPKSLPDQLEILDLRCNFVAKLNNLDFIGMQKLKVLLLSRNKITVVEDGAFEQLSSLEVLDLSYNPIKLLSRTSFIGPRGLKEIYLVSLKDLIHLEEPLSFPAPESAHLEVLSVESSPVLANQLMDDVAALTMFHELFELNLNHCRLSTLRNDLPKYLPRLHKLELIGNTFNCTNIMWLVKWLQAMNISMQGTGRCRQKIYSLKDNICCQKADVAVIYDRAKVICSSPEYLSGKEIISLEEENFPDLELTSSTLPSAKQSFIMEHYIQVSLADSRNNTPSTDMIDTSSTLTLSIHNSTNVTVEKPFLTDFTTIRTQKKSNMLKTELDTLSTLQDRLLNIAHTLEKEKLVKPVKTKLQKRKNFTNDNKHSNSLVANTVLFNKTKLINRDFDNQTNESVRSGAYQSHELPPASHPGMAVFLLVLSGILIAITVMVYSQCSQSYRSHNYQHQQDIEVSSFGGNDLW